ncbi:putative Transcription initiation factor TFIID subunit 11 [Glarea lozoyensis 74030]|uniref:Putative Transcription initiation factor TFIID subunit 11 n=1 Tax=Glarea lozoyensis (strain ATCC 74030 / MF5533) TaxID=1104152 RepID=H0EHB5_GLAL7|nr:putative Transcription initiation factor TFIID subunit 11 [Glarea lozoyensis 74030]
MVSGSVAGVGQPKKKRGPADVQSTTSGPAGKNNKRRASNASLEDEEDAGNGTTAIQMAAETTEQKMREKEHQALLVRGLDPIQTDRYANYRQSRLLDPIVRRIINQTLSQSVGAPIILAVKTIAKMFAGELIEDARRIQTQWIIANGDDQVGEFLSPPAKDAVKPEKETRRGPLLPDHLREAIRRYRLRREGGSVAQLGLFHVQRQSGVERFGLRVKGKRLLK